MKILGTNQTVARDSFAIIASLFMLSGFAFAEPTAIGQNLGAGAIAEFRQE